jgi:hypothetical protein
MDTVAVIIQEASKGWQANRDWIIPAIAIIVQIAMIFFIVKNTNRQIKNQNKELHKPYIVVENFSTKLAESPPNNYNEYSIYNALKKLNDYPSGINSIFEIKNVGYGLATNIMFYGISETIAHRLDIDKEDDVQYFFTKYLSHDDVNNMEIMVSPKQVDSNYLPTTFNLMMFYSDLNFNIYSTLISITMPGRSKITFHPQNTINYRLLLNTHKVNYKKLLKEYVKSNLNKM